MIVNTALVSRVMVEVPDPPDDDEDEDPVATGLVIVWLLPPQPDSAAPSAAAVINPILAFIAMTSQRGADR
jgi:hypothetical protein